MTELVQIISGTFGVLGFGVLFNIRGRRMAATVALGCLSWTIFVLLGALIESEAVKYFIVALVISLLAEALARYLKTPTTTFTITALVPLVPGGSLYYTMAYAFESDLKRFVSKALDTLALAAALALGIIAATTLTTLYFKAKMHIKRKV